MVNMPIRSILTRCRALSLLSVIIVVASLLAPASAIAAEPLKVYFAGFAFASDNAHIQKEFPYTNELLQEKDGDVVRLKKALDDRLDSIHNPGISLQGNDKLGNSKSGDAVSLAFAVDWENVSTEQLGNDTKIVVDLHAQILVFDFTEKKLIGAFPIRMQVIDSQPGKPSHEHILELFRNIYYGDAENNIFDQFVERMNKVSIKQAYHNRIGVTSVILEDKAKNTLKEAKDSKADETAFKSFAARVFSESLSNNQSVAVLPYSQGGQVIGGAMKLRFSNLDVYQLEIPEPDYYITLVIRGFKKVKADESSTETAWAYGSYAHVKIELPESPKPYMDTDFKYAVSKTVPVRLTDLDDWTDYQESLMAMFDNITKQISAQDSSWIGKWATGNNVADQFAAVENVIKKCR